jgi:4-amino-4-deoxy-L-arabinose transferase-like glycosyltransferase
MIPDKTFPFSTKHFYIALGVFILLMKASLFTQRLVDWDEIVYLYLSEHMGWFLGNYTLHGSFIERALTFNVYSATVFAHPPLIPYMIKVLSLFFSPLISAKIINLGLVFLSFFLIYNISIFLSDSKGALIATSLWAICPIFNLESNLIHLDFPLGVFLLLGIWFFIRYQRSPEKIHELFLSAIAFVLAMLTKYYGPIYILIPFGLIMAERNLYRDRKNIFIFFSILLVGFVWWLYIFLEFGSLIPPEFIGYRDGKIFSTPYLKSISERKWYDLWLYFAAICPLFFVYLAAIASYISQLARNLNAHLTDPLNVRILVIINGTVITCIVIFSLINAYAHGYWTMRHIFPVYPVIYITIGYVISLLLSKKESRLNAYLLVFIFLNMVFMSFSTILTMLNQAGLKAIPAFYFWVPGLNVFYS